MSLTTGNKNIVLIMGIPSSGKSTSLKYLKDPESTVYFNTDLKELPFKSEFIEVSITDPKQIFTGIKNVEEKDNVTGAILDTITYLMNRYEQQYVVNSTNTQKAWGEYASFYMNFIHAIKAGTKDYAILSHQADQLNEKEHILETRIPVKGAVGRLGVEADFTTILGAKRMPLSIVKKYESDLLTFSDEEEEDGFKYVFQTRITKDTIGEKMRSADGLWNREHLYINNDLDLVFKQLHNYYQ